MLINASAKLEVVLNAFSLKERKAEADVCQAPREAGQLDHHHRASAQILLDASLKSIKQSCCSDATEGTNLCNCPAHLWRSDWDPQAGCYVWRTSSGISNAIFADRCFLIPHCSLLQPFYPSDEHPPAIRSSAH